MEEKIKTELAEIAKMLHSDGGDCELVKIDGKTVTLQLQGACGSCPYAMETLKGYVQENLRETVDPEIVVERV